MWIINREGVVLECPDPAHSGPHVEDATIQIDKNSDLLTKMREIVRGGHGEGSVDIMDNGRVSGKPVLNHVVFMPILLPGGNYWTIAYAMPENLVLANMRTFRNYWLLVASIGLFILFLYSYFLIRSMIIADGEKKRRIAEHQLPAVDQLRRERRQRLRHRV